MLKHTKTTVSVCSYQDRLSRPRGNDFWRKTDSDFIFPTVQLKGDPAKRLKNTRITEIILEGHSWSISSISGIWTYYIYTCHTDRRFRNTRWTVLKNKEIFYFEYTWFCTCSTDAHREIILRMDPLDTYIYFFFYSCEEQKCASIQLFLLKGVVVIEEMRGRVLWLQYPQ